MEAIDERIGEFVEVDAPHLAVDFGVYQGLNDDGLAIVTDFDGDVWYIDWKYLRY